MTTYTKEERWEILRLAKRTRGLYTAEKQALVFVADAMTMQDGTCHKALKAGVDFGYNLRNIQRGLHGKQRGGKEEYAGLIKRGLVMASGNVKGGRAAGGRGLTATYTIDRDVLLTYVPDTDDPNGDDEPPKKGDTLGDTQAKKGDTLGDTQAKKGDTLGDYSHTSSLSSSLTASAESADASAAAEKLRAAASAPIGEPSPTTTNSTTAQETAERTSTSESQPIGDGGFASSITFDIAGSAPRTSAEPTVPSPFPLPSPTGERCAGSSPSPTLGQNNSDPSDSLISVVRLRQLERSMTDAQIYAEYKAVFDRVVREAEAYDNTPRKDREGMPCGKAFENPLNSTVKHRAAAADFYRIAGGASTLAKWEDFLVNTDHTKFVGKPVLDENDVPTGKFYSDEEEAKWLLYDFVKEQGGVPQPAPVVHSITDEERVIEMLVDAGISRESALRECGRLGVQKIWDGIREVLQEKTT